MVEALLAPRSLLTVLFAVSAVPPLGRPRRPSSSGIHDRVDHLLHAAMGLAMVLMLWSSVAEPIVTAMTCFFLAAGVWFPLAAVWSPRTATGFEADRTSAVAARLPHAIGMIAMVWMLHAPHAGAGAAHAHTTGSAVPARLFGGSAPAEAAGASVTAVLALSLLGCALWSLTRPMPGMRAAVRATRLAAAAEPFRHVRDGATALGTAVMLVMPH
ncbi:DUF5134 domain-containing protein [Streptomyces sp. NPDC059805]|jgi:hypothetical protein|uniref:DUF5134 domain-containing protein n=1 Tax=unclassified Streptomyces TaxID=2593676 RepID=UPI003647BAB3